MTRDRFTSTSSTRPSTSCTSTTRDASSDAYSTRPLSSSAYSSRSNFNATTSTLDGTRKSQKARTLRKSTAHAESHFESNRTVSRPTTARPTTAATTNNHDVGVDVVCVTEGRGIGSEIGFSCFNQTRHEFILTQVRWA